MSDANVESGGLPTERDLLIQRARLLGITFSPNIGVDTLRDRVKAKMEEIDGNAPAEPAESAPAPASDKQIPEVVQTDETGEKSGSFDDDIDEDDEPAENEPAAQTNGFDAAAQLAAAKVSAPPTGEIRPIKPIGNGPVNLSVGGARGQATQVREGKTPTLRQYIYNEQMKLVRLRIQNLDPKKSDLNGEILTIANKHLGMVKQFVPYGEVTDDGWHVPYIIYKELERRRFLHIRTVKDKVTKQPVVKKSWAKEFALEILPPLTSRELASLKVAQAAAGSIDQNNDNIL